MPARAGRRRLPGGARPLRQRGDRGEHRVRGRRPRDHGERVHQRLAGPATGAGLRGHPHPLPRPGHGHRHAGACRSSPAPRRTPRRWLATRGRDITHQLDRSRTTAVPSPARRCSTRRIGWLECETWRTYDGADHTIVVGTVLAAARRAGPRRPAAVLPLALRLADPAPGQREGPRPAAGRARASGPGARYRYRWWVTNPYGSYSAERGGVVGHRLQVGRDGTLLGAPLQQRVDDPAGETLAPPRGHHLHRRQPEPVAGDDATPDRDRPARGRSASTAAKAVSRGPASTAATTSAGTPAVRPYTDIQASVGRVQHLHVGDAERVPARRARRRGLRHRGHLHQRPVVVPCHLPAGVEQPLLDRCADHGLRQRRQVVGGRRTPATSASASSSGTPGSPTGSTELARPVNPAASRSSQSPSYSGARRPALGTHPLQLVGRRSAAAAPAAAAPACRPPRLSSGTRTRSPGLGLDLERRRASRATSGPSTSVADASGSGTASR